jgi:hypothetical protein
LALTLIDKGLIGLLLLFAGFILNKVLEKYKSSRALKNELAKIRDTKKLEYMEKQLSQFYWPLYIRLQIVKTAREAFKDSKMINNELREEIGPEKYDGLCQKISSEIERNFLIPNREEIIGIIQANIHLMEGDTPAFNAMRQCIKHIAVYKGMKAAEYHDKSPRDLGAPWPEELLTLVSGKAYEIQKLYDDLADPTKAA